MVNGLNVQFRAVGTRSLWQVIKTGIVINDFFIPFENVDYITVSSSPKLLGNGIVRFKEKGRDQEIHLLYSSPFSEMVQEAVYEANYQINELNGKQQAIDHLCSSTGTLLEVFDEYLLIKHMGTNLGLLFSDQSAGIKRIDYDQLTAIQYKKPGNIAGYLQFAYPGSMENKGNRAFDILNDENTIPVSALHVDDADRIYEFIEKRRIELKQASATKGVVNQISGADELLKFKQLLDMGVITQEEFEAKKKQILGI